MAARSVNPESIRRLLEIEEGYRMNPGRMPNGTGTTGIGRYDSQGYTDMLNERLEYLNLRADAEGKNRPDVEVSEGRFPVQYGAGAPMIGSNLVATGTTGPSRPFDAPAWLNNSGLESLYRKLETGVGDDEIEPYDTWTKRRGF